MASRCDAFDGYRRRRLSESVLVLVSVLGLLFVWLVVSTQGEFISRSSIALFKPISRREAELKKAALDKCRYIRTPAGPSPDFALRTESDRFVPGTPAILIRNATIWTGKRVGLEAEVISGDILLDKGLVRAVGTVSSGHIRATGSSLKVHDANGAWVTAGLVDLHSHIGVGSSPHLSGAADTNSRKAPILPWLRSIDGLNTHDASYELAIAGGVTAAQILPGSANNIGGQAFVIKLRTTEERSTNAKVLEPPYTLNGTHFDHNLVPRWRHMKHACGENPSRVYSQTRMDSAWEFRHAYDEARKVKEAQDSYCTKVESRLWDSVDVEHFPEDIQWEALVDVLRGKVKVSVHCYEAVDLDAIVRLTNEFQFPVASFHHAGETYLVPELLKKTWGGVPSIALFASNARKKREAYRGSEFAPRILAEHNIPVVMKSDHPVVNSRYLLNEAAQAHYYGLHPTIALASVTSTPADAAGMGHRIGRIRPGNDADLIIWDARPLVLGATPKQVFIDGIAQIASPYTSPKPKEAQKLPVQPDFDREANDTLKYEGLPPLEPRVRHAYGKDVVFSNVLGVYFSSREADLLFQNASDGLEAGELKSVYVRDGAITCVGIGLSCVGFHRSAVDSELELIDLKGGVLAPGLVTFGSPLGLVEIRMEQSTNDGSVYNALEVDGVPQILGANTFIRAVDGLQFGGRNTLLAYRAGVTTAITPPSGSGVILGVSAAFAPGALSALETGAVIQEEVALHVQVGRSLPQSVSTQIALLRRLLYDDADTGLNGRSEEAKKLKQVLNDSILMSVRKGRIPLVIHVENADIMSTLLGVKSTYESRTGEILRVTFAGAAEAHLIAREIAEAGVSVIVSPSRPFPGSWDQRRILPGPPLSYESSITTLLKNNVTVAVGVVDEYTARNTRFDIAWAALESHGKIGEKEALALATTNLERALGLKPSIARDIVAYRGGGLLETSSKVVAVVSPGRRIVDLF